MAVESFGDLAKESLSLAILLPIVWYFIRHNDKAQNEKFNLLAKTMREGFELMTKAFTDHESNEMLSINSIHASIIEHSHNSEKHFLNMNMKMGNTALNKEQTVNLLLTNMWMVSYGKLEYIRNVLKVNHIDGRESVIRKKIRAELERKSGEYMKTFTEYLTPIGDLAEWLNKVFGETEFDLFIDTIMERVYTKQYSHHSKEAAIELQMNDISTIMKELQNNLANKLRKDIESYQ